MLKPVLSNMKKIDTWMIYFCALWLRIMLIVYAEWQDANMEVKFTDVDYYVFSDAATFVSFGQSPYCRATYRYSPILAWLLLPNIYLHQAWGKVLFVIGDFMAAVFLQSIMQQSGSSKLQQQFAIALWLLNPLTATVSCRGNAESIMAALVLGVLHFLLSKQIMFASVLFALAVHLKIYPIVYSLAILFYLGENKFSDKNQNFVYTLFNCIHKRKLSAAFKKVVTYNNIMFFTCFLFVFVIMTALMYFLYGFDFLDHTYLYHIKRRDIRHNFSVYFYMLYINNAHWLGLLTFVTQLSLVILLSSMLYKQLAVCFFVLTYTFVTFNKICTSQYFLWYFSIVPVLLNGFTRKHYRSLILVAVLWFFGQGIWLAPAYCIEFLGWNTFQTVWLAGILFFATNVFIIGYCIYHYFSPQADFVKNKKD
uniref:GPI alpha-1,4-mannosyltransferase I, catalytic subunit n=1 Tax=Phallusia mammillata TaxID=59560 RepID=A0A6F9DPP4_9ASCI|nr:GPI mannosyltransferase 1-like [Phallusia mammillata]